MTLDPEVVQGCVEALSRAKAHLHAHQRVDTQVAVQLVGKQRRLPLLGPVPPQDIGSDLGHVLPGVQIGGAAEDAAALGARQRSPCGAGSGGGDGSSRSTHWWP